MVDVSILAHIFDTGPEGPEFVSSSFLEIFQTCLRRSMNMEVRAVC